MTMIANEPDAGFHLWFLKAGLFKRRNGPTKKAMMSIESNWVVRKENTGCILKQNNDIINNFIQ